MRGKPARKGVTLRSCTIREHLDADSARDFSENTINHRLFLPSPNFNDPFGLQGSDVVQGSEKDWRRAFAEMFERRFPHMGDAERHSAWRSDRLGWYKDANRQRPS